jgi:hypothetical protein
MRNFYTVIFVVLLASQAPLSLFSQKSQTAKNQITSSDLETYVSFLASPLLQGRMNGEPGLEIAAGYISSQARLIGLKPANGGSYIQPYSITKKSMDPEKTSIRIISNGKDTTTIKEPMYQLVPTGASDFTLEGEVIFAGYGIKADKYNYNDLSNINAEGKILLIMNRAPMSADGKTCLFRESGWISEMSFQIKLTTLILSKAKAILIVTDPKSGFKSFDESNWDIAAYLKSTISLAGEKEEMINPFMAKLPKVIFIHSSVADALLKGSGHSLEELQKDIDSNLRPNSFIIENKKFELTEVSLKEEKTLNNIAGYIEGSDPVLKNEFIVFSCHYDHLGASGSKVFSGADDNASGCAALLSIAEAFQSLKKKPLRSVLFLWVSGEEIGLFGSKSYVDHPLFPLEKTIADINIDMIGRVKGAADSTSKTPVTGPDTVYIVADNQSKELISIADKVSKKNMLTFDYSLSGRNHPLQLFSRSDHYNFVQKDIPILSVTTGIPADYHTPGDVVEKIDFKKMERITRTIYEIGFDIASRKNRLVVDNPFSTWGKSR